MESLGLIVRGLSGPSSHCGLENRLVGAGVGLLEESRSKVGDKAAKLKISYMRNPDPAKSRTDRDKTTYEGRHANALEGRRNAASGSSLHLDV